MERRQLKEIKKAVDQHDWKKVQEIAEDLLFQTCLETRVKRKDWIKFRDEAWKLIQNRKINLIPEQGSIYQKPKDGRFKYGDKVWDKIHNCVVGFVDYNYDGSISVKNGVVTVIYRITDIEPYTGQDKPKYEPGEMVWWEDSYGIFTGTYKFDSYSKSLGTVLLIGLHGSKFKNVPLSELSKINHKAMKP